MTAMLYRLVYIAVEVDRPHELQNAISVIITVPNYIVLLNTFLTECSRSALLVLGTWELTCNRPQWPT